jgi:drug/metabolite transporter (DMT)-like permease
MSRTVAVWIGVFVTFLWSSSYILNKLAFNEGISPIMLAGLRYSIAVIAIFILSYFLQRRKNRREQHSTVTKVPETKLKMWHYILLGITGYLMAQGLQYAGQYFISPTQTSMMLSIGNNLFIILLDIIWLREVKSRGIFIGVFGLIVGIILYYYPWHFETGALIGIGLVLLSSIGYSINLMANRYFISNGMAQAKHLVLRPMLIGALFMVFVGLLQAGIPTISLKLWILLLWLGIINGALAFYLWTWIQKTLRAYESSVLNNLVLVQVAVLDVIVLNQSLSILQIIALILLLASVCYVSLEPNLKKNQPKNKTLSS